jgi:uncharacterized membrane protein YczE
VKVPKVWIYALREGLRTLLVAELSWIATFVGVYLVQVGFELPSAIAIGTFLRVAAIGAIVIFPVSVVGVRHEIWNRNLVKPKK